MCIIVYKPKNQKFPSKETLRNCFINNPDGAGFMCPAHNSVIIMKGFDTFNKFYKALCKAKKIYGERIPYVMHFRISTQAHGRMDCTHPFPLSTNMSDLRKLYTKANIGIAHNGIIHLTSTFGYSKQITYSDTMKFITDYAALIIKDKNYYKDQNTLTLLERLAESKLAIMDADGHVELIGKFIAENGIIYSNSSYKAYKPIATAKPSVTTTSSAPAIAKPTTAPTAQFTLSKEDHSYFDSLDDADSDSDDDWFSSFDKENYDPWSDFYDPDKGVYNFDPMDCPCSYQYDFYEGQEYCDNCKNHDKCYDILEDII